ncbi:MAG: NUDIX domain-containing protein [Spirochaetes bacterium]|nr:NUDIX domain-containing protein [Spirochaetota bacterium]MBU0954315.1 NUDIX domain-containing protein [Spirochaetota bacterium]
MRYDYAVYIGRFQPPHRGHFSLMQQAAEIADTLLLCVGSAYSSRSLRNPFTFSERQDLLLELTAGLPCAVACLPLRDSAYNFTEWLIHLRQAVLEYACAQGKPDASIILIGARKDESSYYLEHIPEWPFHRFPVAGSYNSTRVRELLAHDPSGLTAAALQEHVEATVAAWLQLWMHSLPANAFREEYAAVQVYRSSWAQAPYPPVFVTVDALVLCSGRVLLVRRGKWPGKDQLALPGGFLEPDEPCKAACLRELREETGLIISDPDKYLLMTHVFDEPYRDPRGRMLTHVFMFSLPTTSHLAELSAADDAEAALWFPLHELIESSSLFFGDHHRIIRYFLNRLQ